MTRLLASASSLFFICVPAPDANVRLPYDGARLLPGLIFGQYLRVVWEIHCRLFHGVASWTGHAHAADAAELRIPSAVRVVFTHPADIEADFTFLGITHCG